MGRSDWFQFAVIAVALGLFNQVFFGVLRALSRSEQRRLEEEWEREGKQDLRE